MHSIIFVTKGYCWAKWNGFCNARSHKRKVEDKWAVATEPQYNLILIFSIHPSVYTADRLVSRLRIGQFKPNLNQVVAASDMVVNFSGYKHWLWTQTSLRSLRYLVWCLSTKFTGRLRTQPLERSISVRGTAGSAAGCIIDLDLWAAGFNSQLLSIPVSL